MEEQTESRVEPSRAGWRSGLKLLVLGALVLVLLVPVASVLGLVRERQVRADEVRREVGAVWGHEQTLGAAVLTLSHRVRQGDLVLVRHLHFLPSEVRWTAEVAPRLRTRGIFEVPVYEARLRASGWFEVEDPASLNVDPAALDWASATLTVGVSDLRGIQERVELDWGGRRLPFGPGTGSPALLPSGLRAVVGGEPLRQGERVPFAFELSLRGTERLQFLPLGEMTTVRVASPWPDPGFGGAFLPRQRELGPDGFTAQWSVPYFGRGYPQAWRDDGHDAKALERGAVQSAFGVTLVRPADQYQQTERSVKYAVLFICLTFTALFLLELLSSVRLHPVHYLLVGFALCLFYVLLLALAEHLGFLAAYLLAAAAVVGLVSLYGRSLLGRWRRVAPLAGTLCGLYAYLYSLLVAQDHSLLLGAVGMFAVLAAVMYLTRNLDWTTLRFERRATLGAPERTHGVEEDRP